MLFCPDTEFWQNPTLILILHAQNGSKLLLEVSGMTSEKKVCGSCNAIDDSDAEFCRECGTALPETDLNQPRVQYPRSLGMARGILLACSVTSLLLMAAIGTETDAVWSGTGYTRGSGDWIPIWSDEFLNGRPN